MKSLKERREAAGLRIADMARLTGLDRGTVKRIEAGEGNPTVESIAKIEAVLADRAENSAEVRRDASEELARSVQLLTLQVQQLGLEVAELRRQVRQQRP